MNTNRHILVTGAGGFIGGHLVKRLLREPWVGRIRAVDIKSLASWFQKSEQVENIVGDLTDSNTCEETCAGVDDVFHLAADMGGIGFIKASEAKCVMNVLIDTNMLVSAVNANVKRFLFSSSACIYNVGKQVANRSDYKLKEEDALPAHPDSGYGWEKLFAEQMCRAFMTDHKVNVRIARLHNVYGPQGEWNGGREKAPAALCRKAIEAKRNGLETIDIWGTGSQMRSFMYIDDTIEGLVRLMQSQMTNPVNLGSEEMVTINDLVTHIELIADLKLRRNYVLNMPVGVHGRCSDNTLIRETLDWEPETTLVSGLTATYRWIEHQIVGNCEG